MIAAASLNPDDQARDLPSKITLELAPDDVVSYQTPGGGGYGDPLERDPQNVLEDVLDGKVSPQRAREIYGVVVNMASQSVDLDATRQCRQGS